MTRILLAGAVAIAGYGVVVNGVGPDDVFDGVSDAAVEAQRIVEEVEFEDVTEFPAIENPDAPINQQVEGTGDPVEDGNGSSLLFAVDDSEQETDLSVDAPQIERPGAKTAVSVEDGE